MKIIATSKFVFRTKSVEKNVCIRVLEGDRVLGRDDVEPGGRGPLPEQGLKWSENVRMSGEQVVGKSLT